MNAPADSVDLSEDERAVNADAQGNELLALEAIFETQFTYHNSEGLIHGCLSVPIALDKDITLPTLPSTPLSSAPVTSTSKMSSSRSPRVRHLPPVTIKFHLPPGYPSRDPPNFVLDCIWLLGSKKVRLKERLLKIWEEEKDVALYNFAEFITHDSITFLDILSSDDVPCIRLFPPDEPPDADDLLRITDAIIEHDRQVVQAEFDVGTYDCGICIETKLGEDCFRFGHCGHVFCRVCLKDYFGLLITEGTINLVTCPDTSCKKSPNTTPLPHTDLQIIVGPSLYTRYSTLLQKQALESRTDVTYCPRPTCQHPVIRDPKQEKLVICPSCNFAFCYFCNRCWHGSAQACRADGLMKIAKAWLEGDERTRRELELRYGKKTVAKLVIDLEAERETWEWKRENTMGCPTCEIGVQKSDGCNHMTCQMCQTHFCYLCGAFLDKRRPYQHFNTVGSECYGRLFEGATHGRRDLDDDDGGVEDEEEEEEEEVFPDDEVIRLAIQHLG